MPDDQDLLIRHRLLRLRAEREKRPNFHDNEPQLRETNRHFLREDPFHLRDPRKDHNKKPVNQIIHAYFLSLKNGEVSKEPVYKIHRE